MPVNELGYECSITELRVRALIHLKKQSEANCLINSHFCYPSLCKRYEKLNCQCAGEGEKHTMELHGGFREPSTSNEMYLKYGEIKKREEKEELLLESIGQMQHGSPSNPLPCCSKGTQNSSERCLGAERD